MALTIVVDDLTGACDTGALFARPAPVPGLLAGPVPCLRVSADHGTAVDRAWKGVASHASMVEAIEVAVRLPGRR